ARKPLEPYRNPSRKKKFLRGLPFIGFFFLDPGSDPGFHDPGHSPIPDRAFRHLFVTFSRSGNTAIDGTFRLLRPVIFPLELVLPGNTSPVTHWS
ncbi:Uncharacterized protein APZ42_004291, partial [Daphnia magna]